MRLKGLLFLAGRSIVGGRGFSFCAKRSIQNRIRRHYVVSKKREQAGGVECSGAKVGNAAKVDEDDDEEDEWTGMMMKRQMEVDRHISKIYGRLLMYSI